jgi:hypothetical protein
MFFCMRSTTAGHSFAVCICGSGSAWHWPQASRKDSALAEFTSGILFASSGRSACLRW